MNLLLNIELLRFNSENGKGDAEEKIYMISQQNYSQKSADALNMHTLREAALSERKILHNHTMRPHLD